MDDDYYPDFDNSWVPIVSGIIGLIIVLALITTLTCYCCAGCALYNRRRDLQMTGVTTVTHAGYGRGMWGREQVVIVHQGNNQAQQQQPPPYFANPEYNPGYSQGQPQNPAYPVQPGTFQGQQHVQPQASDSHQFMKPHMDTNRY